MHKKFLVLCALLASLSCLGMEPSKPAPGASASEATPLLHSEAAAEREVACAICLSERIVGAQITLPCGHSFCERCIYDWRAANHGAATCPLCRAHVPPAPAVEAGLAAPDEHLYEIDLHPNPLALPALVAAHAHHAAAPIAPQAPVIPEDIAVHVQHVPPAPVQYPDVHQVPVAAENVNHFENAPVLQPHGHCHAAPPPVLPAAQHEIIEAEAHENCCMHALNNDHFVVRGNECCCTVLGKRTVNCLSAFCCPPCVDLLCCTLHAPLASCEIAMENCCFCPDFCEAPTIHRMDDWASCPNYHSNYSFQRSACLCCCCVNETGAGPGRCGSDARRCTVLTCWAMGMITIGTIPCWLH